IKETVHEQGSGVLVDLVFDRLAAQRHLDDYVQVVGRVLAHRNGVDVHVVFSPWGGAMEEKAFLPQRPDALQADLLKPSGKTRRTIMKFISAAVLGLGLGALTGEISAYDSAYTDLDLDACEKIAT